MRRALSDPVPHSTALPLTPPRLTPAAGHGVAATVPVSDRGGDALLEAADAAMLRAKRAGRDQVCLA